METNYNSWIVLDRRPPDAGAYFCRAQQWTWLNGSNQHWREYNYGSGNWQLIVKSGCAGYSGYLDYGNFDIPIYIDAFPGGTPTDSATYFWH